MAKWLTETSHLLRREDCDADELFALAENGMMRIGLRFEDERAARRELMARFRHSSFSIP